jgi:hypothetical protein
MPKRKNAVVLYDLPTEYLATFLCYVDSMSLLHACPKLYKPVDFAEIVRLRLASIEFDPNMVFKVLRETKSVLTGSFVLACMFNEQGWEPGDIDIVSRVTLAEQFTCVVSDTGSIVRVPNLPMKCTTLQFPNCSKSLDVITCEDPKRFIKECFDLSFCRVAFDSQKLHVSDWQSIVTKSAVIDVSHWVNVSRRFGNLSTGNEHKIFHQLAARCAKYRARNFNVSVNLGNVDLVVNAWRFAHNSRAPPNRVHAGWNSEIAAFLLLYVFTEEKDLTKLQAVQNAYQHFKDLQVYSWLQFYPVECALIRDALWPAEQIIQETERITRSSFRTGMYYPTRMLF